MADVSRPVDDGEEVQLFARPSAKDLKRRRQQQQQKQESQNDHHASANPSSKRARAGDSGAVGGEGAGVGAGAPSPAALLRTTTDNAESFEQLGVSSWLCSVLRTVGITRPTPVQAACIPAILAGRDAVGLAQTGSGKTAAFALPALQLLSRDGPYGVFCLVLTPTRELAFQLADQFRAFGAGMALRDAVVVGGLDARAQAAELARRPHVVVATPGRLAELLRQDERGGLAAGFARVRFLVLDEADRLLDASFEDALRVIVAALPKSSAGGAGGGGAAAGVRRQTLLFSATATRALLRLQEAALPDALVFSAYEAERRREVAAEKKKKKKEGEEEGEDEGDDNDDNHPPTTLAALAALEDADPAARLPENLRQEYAFVPQRVKDVYLAHVLEAWLGLGAAAEQAAQLAAAAAAKAAGRRGGKVGGKHYYKGGADPSSVAAAKPLLKSAGTRAVSAIVFAGTCRGCRLLELLAAELGMPCAALHARKPQRQRLAALAAFRSGAVPLLIATDVAARGLDIPSVGLVVNYDLPALPRDYVHRVGRTARAGRSGRALSLVSPSDVARLKAVEALTGRELAECPELAGADAEQDVMRRITRVFGARRAALMALAEEDDALAETLERRKEGWGRGMSAGGGGKGSDGKGSGGKGVGKKRDKDKKQR
jgi:ATP-dependent RNA helicase DDX49/DBP8